MVVHDGSSPAQECYVMVVVAAFAVWHMGMAFLVGVVFDQTLRHGWVRI